MARAAAWIALGSALLVGLLWLLRGPPKNPAPDSRGAVAPAQEDTHRQEEHARVIAGSVRDDLGRPLERAVVRVQALDETGEAPAREIQTDNEGRFHLGGLPHTALAVEVTMQGHDGLSRVVLPQDAGPLAFVLPRQGELLVELRDEPGRPVVGTEVFVTGPGLWPAARCEVSERGECLFRGLAGGQYRAQARHGERVAPASPPVTVVPGERGQVSLALKAGLELRGTVIDRTSRRPLPGVELAAQGMTPGIPETTVRSDAEGVFQLAGLWPGNVRVTAVLEGFAPFAADIELPQADPLTLSLEGSASLAGRVVDEQGRPIPGALLSVSTRDGQPAAALPPRILSQGEGELGVTRGPVPHIPLLAEQAFALGALAAESGADGSFRIEGLEPSAVVLRATRAGYAPATLELEGLAPHREKTGVQLMLRRAGRVEGRVHDARGRGIGGVYVAALSGDQSEQSALTDDDGNFVLRDLLGEVTVRAQPDGRAPVACTVSVQAEAVARCDLSADSVMHTLQVRVVDEYGVGIPGALVQLRANQIRRTFTQTTERDGSLAFRELPQPPYTLSVRLRGYLTAENVAVSSTDEELQIALRQAASLSGTVMDALGRAVPHAFVSTDEGEASSETDERGTFWLEGVAPGVLTVWATHPEGGEGSSQEVRARAGDMLSGLRIVLSGRITAARADAGSPSARSERARQEDEGAAEEPSAKPSEYALEQRGNAVVVSSVTAGSAAARAGLRAGDVLASIDGEPVLSSAHARGMLRDPPNTTANLRVLRNRQPIRMRYRRPPL